MRAVFIALVVLMLAACASQRIVQQSDTFSQDISGLPIREVVKNFDKMVEDPFHIPSRTTFGNGSLQFADNNQLTITQPFHNIARSSSSLGATLGQFVDQYSLAIKPETDATTLLHLRNLYHGVMYGEWLGADVASHRKDPRWLYWANQDGSPSGYEPTVDAKAIGAINGRVFYVTDQKAFSDFVLESFGAKAGGTPVPAASGRAADGTVRTRAFRRSGAPAADGTPPSGSSSAPATTPRNGAGISERQKGDTPSNFPTVLRLQ